MDANQTLLERLITRQTGRTAPNQFKATPVLEFESQATGESTHNGFGQTFEFHMRAIVQTVFWCNPAQYGDAKSNATKALMTELYRDVLELTNQAKQMAYAGDQRETLRILCEMESLMRGK